MPFLELSDLKTHIYGEIIAEICRDDDTIAQQAIADATEEAQAYLGRYDLAALFSPDEPLTFRRGHLKAIVKDMACWFLVRLANPNINLEVFRTMYEDAKAFLKDVQAGRADPAGWPYKIDDPSTPGNENSGIQWSSNPKRQQHF